MTPEEQSSSERLRIFALAMVLATLLFGAVTLGMLLNDAGRQRTPQAETTAPRSSETATPSTSPSRSAPTNGPGSATSEKASATPTVAAPRGTPISVSGYRAGKQIFDAPLDPIELNAQGFLVPDFNRAGWFAQDGWKSQKPGVPGPSIVAAHVNQLDPAGKVVDDHFARLHTMRPGDKVRVRYSSGDAVEFTVARSQAVDKVRATDVSDPLAKSIWEPGEDKAYLRLFTCDEDTPWVQGHYVGNWVVWAEDAKVVPKASDDAS